MGEGAERARLAHNMPSLEERSELGEVADGEAVGRRGLAYVWEMAPYMSGRRSR